MFDLKPSHYVHINVPDDGLAVMDALDIEVVLLLVEEGNMVVVDVLLVTVVGDSVVDFQNYQDGLNNPTGIKI